MNWMIPAIRWAQAGLRSFLGDLLQCIALLGLFAIIAEQLDDLRSLIKNVEADAAAAAALETASAWRSLWAVQLR
jgi:hypothetical protein